MTAEDYRLEFTTAAARQLRKLDQPNAERIRTATELLPANHDHPAPPHSKAAAAT